MSSNIRLLIIEDNPGTVKSELERMKSDLDETLIHIRKEGLIRRFDYKKPIQVFSFYSRLLTFQWHRSLHGWPCFPMGIRIIFHFGNPSHNNHAGTGYQSYARTTKKKDNSSASALINLFGMILGSLQART